MTRRNNFILVKFSHRFLKSTAVKHFTKEQIRIIYLIGSVVSSQMIAPLFLGAFDRFTLWRDNAPLFANKDRALTAPHPARLGWKTKRPYSPFTIRTHLEDLCALTGTSFLNGLEKLVDWQRAVICW